MIGSLFEIIKPITVFSTTSRKQKQFSYREQIDSGIFLLISEKTPFIDWTIDFYDLLLSVAKSNGLNIAGSSSGPVNNVITTYNIIKEEGKPYVAPSDLFLPITWCNEILLVDKYFQLSTTSFNDYIKSGSIYMHEKKKRSGRVH